MTTSQDLAVLVLAAACLVPGPSAAWANGCPELAGKGAAERLQYLTGDRSKLTPQCVVWAVRTLGDKRYPQAVTVLIKYLDYQDPAYVHQAGVRGSFFYVYPAVDAVSQFGKPVVPQLIAAAADENATDMARQNAAEAIALIYGAARVDAISAIVSAARAQEDPRSSARLMDQARWLSARCAPAIRNECEQALLK